MAFWKSEGKGEFFDLEIPRHRGSYDCNSQGMFSFFFRSRISNMWKHQWTDNTADQHGKQDTVQDKHWLIIHVFAFIYRRKTIKHGCTSSSRGHKVDGFFDRLIIPNEHARQRPATFLCKQMQNMDEQWYIFIKKSCNGIWLSEYHL